MRYFELYEGDDEEEEVGLGPDAPPPQQPLVEEELLKHLRPVPRAATLTLTLTLALTLILTLTLTLTRCHRRQRTTAGPTTSLRARRSTSSMR